MSKEPIPSPSEATPLATAGQKKRHARRRLHFHLGFRHATRRSQQDLVREDKEILPRYR